MKTNKLERKRPKSLIALGAILFLVSAAVGITLAYEKLCELCHEPCVMTDVTSLVTCTGGNMVKSGTVLDKFGVRNGANLAEIDFDAKRLEILREIPNIREISVTRHLPNRLEIAIEERQPIVRLGVHGKPGVTGRVADREGVVFTCRRGTGMLPTIRERETSVTPIGQHLQGRALAALQMIEIASDARFAKLGMLDADITKHDFILATLGNYAQAKIAWDGMDAPTAANLGELVVRLEHLLKAVESNIGEGAKVWNATERNRIYADTREDI